MASQDNTSAILPSLEARAAAYDEEGAKIKTRVQKLGRYFIYARIAVRIVQLASA